MEKNDVQTEFAALMRAMKDLGFRPADVARMLNKSKGAISQYMSRQTMPSNTVMELLRRVVNEKRGVDVVGKGELQKKLESLKRFEPEQYDVLKKTIEMLHGQVIKPLPASSVERISTIETHDDEAKLAGKTSLEIEGDEIGSPEIRFLCPRCRQRLKMLLKNAGRSIVCPSCSVVMKIPDLPRGRSETDDV